ncbi:MAG: hypothetical protein WCT04_17580, partial [Planctomycetota bacterium]
NIISFHHWRSILPEALWLLDCPKNWACMPVGMTAADIEAGRQFWQLATLQDRPRNTKTLRAHCVDCHAIDGRDLQYFGFSNQRRG